jgi:hypothetical protein
MTSLTRTEAIIKKFPFLKKHIPDFLIQEDETFTVEFFPLSVGIFLSKKRSGGKEPICISMYSESGDSLPEIEDGCTVEHYVCGMKRYVEGYQEVHYIVRSKAQILQVYMPPPNTVFLAYMNAILEEERRKAKDELEKTLSGLYKKDGPISSGLQSRLHEAGIFG